MATIHLNGVRMEIAPGALLSSILSDHPQGCAVAIIRPATQEQTRTANLAITTTAGDITIEVARRGCRISRICPQLLRRFPSTGQTGTRRHSGHSLQESGLCGNPICTNVAMLSSGAEGTNRNDPTSSLPRTGIRQTMALMRLGA